MAGQLRGWELLLWFTAASGYLDGARPVDLLATSPDEVVRAAGYQASQSQDSCSTARLGDPRCLPPAGALPYPLALERDSTSSAIWPQRRASRWWCRPPEDRQARPAQISGISPSATQPDPKRGAGQGTITRGSSRRHSPESSDSSTRQPGSRPRGTHPEWVNLRSEGRTQRRSGARNVRGRRH